MKIGIDVGGTKTEGILIDNLGKELARKRIKTEKNYEGTINGIISIVKKFEVDFGVTESIGVGMPIKSEQACQVKRCSEPMEYRTHFDSCHGRAPTSNGNAAPRPSPTSPRSTSSLVAC